MPDIVAERFRCVKASPSMAAKARVDALRAAGMTIVDFTLGEPDFPTPPHIVDAAIAAMRGGQTRYTASGGTPALRQAIARKLQRENGIGYAPEDVVVGCGAKQIIFNAFATSLNPGDEVIVPAPFWVSYTDMVAINGGTPIVVPCAEHGGWKLTAEVLEAAISPRTRWLVLNTPNNPSGAVYTEDELRALTEVLLRHPDVWLLTDEIYEHFLYDDAQHHSAVRLEPALRTRALSVSGVSKAYAMTGWRVGYGAGPRKLIGAIDLMLSQSTTCASAISQAAAAAALDGPQECIAEAVATFAERRDRIVALLNGIPGFRCGHPSGAFYVFASVDALIGKTDPSGHKLDSDAAVMSFLLEHAGVAAVDGASYGVSPYLRFSFATSLEQIEQGCARIREACALLDG
ncbi:MAG: aminotransferase class I/II-fold pyridoxal phosphate-dependent enzyme [Casimicrobiaceae bacterium]